jgi:hypothetical protein
MILFRRIFYAPINTVHKRNEEARDCGPGAHNDLLHSYNTSCDSPRASGQGWRNSCPGVVVVQIKHIRNLVAERGILS